jgi:hypothetical protein
MGSPDCKQDLEICVPEALLSDAASLFCSAYKFYRVEKEDYDIFTEYKKGFLPF